MTKIQVLKSRIGVYDIPTRKSVKSHEKMYTTKNREHSLTLLSYETFKDFDNIWRDSHDPYFTVPSKMTGTVARSNLLKASRRGL
jgi:hypothetical protein